MAKITIITPAYNRGELLERLYNSLLKQTSRDFEWLIVDDGSRDDTEQRVQRWQAEEKLKIEYVKQQNGGKHRALNRGIKKICTELTFIVDSDDYLPSDSIQIIMNYHAKYQTKREELGICGYSFLRFYSNGEVNTAYFSENEEVDTYLQIRINGNIGGDKAEVFFSDVLKKYPFPEFPGEKFMPEDVVWMQMSGAYKMVHINECIYISDYLEGGLTRSGRRMKWQSPRGMVLRSKEYINNKNVNLKIRTKMMLLYHIYGKAARISIKDRIGETNSKLLVIMCLIPAQIIYIYWQARFSD